MAFSGQKCTDDELKEFHWRTRRCDDCGFTKGTAANLSGVTDIKAQLCAEVPTPFLCHFNAVENEIPDGKETLCFGWIEKCEQLQSEGYYDKQPEWLSKYKEAITDVISEIENTVPDENAVGYFQHRMREMMESV